MATPEFKYQPMFEHGKDTTEYYLLTKDYVSVSEFEGKPILKIEKEGLTAMANAAFRDVSFMLRRSHNEQVAKILTDPEASDNDKYVALTFLRNAEVAAKGVLPFCQDTGTAIIHGEKGQQVWTGYCDEEALSLGVYKTYTEENLRYSQNAPLTMYEEVNTRCNLPAQIDIEATQGMEYEFLCVTKGGGSANKTYLYQETKAILNPATLVPFLVEKMKTLGTAACPPYHIAFVIGGTSAEKNLLTVKLASTRFYDNLPTTGNEYGRAFRDVELEKQVLEEAHRIGLGAQFGGKYYAHDVRIIRLPRHGASCPVGFKVKPFNRQEDLEGLKTTEGLPGQYPYIRGIKKDDNTWFIRQDINVNDAAEANAKALDILNKGVDSLGFHIKAKELNAEYLDTLLKDICCECVELNFSTCQRHTLQLAQLLVAYFQKKGYAPEKLKGSLNFDPISKMMQKGKDVSAVIATGKELVETLAAYPHFRCIAVNSVQLNNAGAYIYQELGYALAWGNEYLNQLVEAGVPAALAAKKIKFNFGISSNYFMEIAKFRAARMLWADIV